MLFLIGVQASKVSASTGVSAPLHCLTTYVLSFIVASCMSESLSHLQLISFFALSLFAFLKSSCGSYSVILFYVIWLYVSFQIIWLQILSFILMKMFFSNFSMLLWIRVCKALDPRKSSLGLENLILKILDHTLYCTAESSVSIL